MDLLLEFKEYELALSRALASGDLDLTYKARRSTPPSSLALMYNKLAMLFRLHTQLRLSLSLIPEPFTD